MYATDFSSPAEPGSRPIRESCASTRMWRMIVAVSITATASVGTASAVAVLAVVASPDGAHAVSTASDGSNRRRITRNMARPRRGCVRQCAATANGDRQYAQRQYAQRQYANRNMQTIPYGRATIGCQNPMVESTCAEGPTRTFAYVCHTMVQNVVRGRDRRTRRDGTLRVVGAHHSGRRAHHPETRAPRRQTAEHLSAR